MNTTENLNAIRENLSIINVNNVRSAWARGVGKYSWDLFGEYEEAVKGGYADGTETGDALENKLLNGAKDWTQYSYGGGALIYDHAICARISTPTEIRRTDGGRLNPNRAETWLDVQARALAQAAERIKRAARKAQRETATA